ncbi:uncharacterized protein F5147DRAFT_771639 [Suillus discolor]|uniref:Uncharacterized protein n=1 Tax=Suillus discolor TaxID=1912936 RepID=A0A9P7FBY3_9AGAM|nr:uncharacterized protein F5147DRAFT_771639 [Suillus discolor]KAG2112071.1 hypothetical protein F5147DRAFT_771639 [Suillus discolor]
MHKDISKLILYATHGILTEQDSPLGYLLLRCQYITETDEENEKGWSFLKLHLTMHIFDDIEAKGVTKNYNTKLNEQMHGPLKNSYQHWTNFKNFAEQILWIDHWLLVSNNICHRVEDMANYLRSMSQADEVDVDADDPAMDELVLWMAHRDVDTGFVDFCIELNAFLNVFLLACNLPLPNGKRVQLQLSDAISTS